MINQALTRTLTMMLIIVDLKKLLMIKSTTLNTEKDKGTLLQDQDQIRLMKAQVKLKGIIKRIKGKSKFYWFILSFKKVGLKKKDLYFLIFYFKLTLYTCCVMFYFSSVYFSKNFIPLFIDLI